MKVSIYKIYTFVVVALLASSSLASMDFLAMWAVFLGRFFTAGKEPNYCKIKQSEDIRGEVSQKTSHSTLS